MLILLILYVLSVLLNLFLIIPLSCKRDNVKMDAETLWCSMLSIIIPVFIILYNIFHDLPARLNKLWRIE